MTEASEEQQYTLSPQPGPQTEFLTSSADAIVYGGAAGGGKSWALLYEPLRYCLMEGMGAFRAVIFRQTYKQIMDPGGLWEKAEEMYPLVGGKAHQTSMTWTFPNGSKVVFAYMQNENDKLKWQGAEVDYVGWDELTHFSASQVSYLWSRCRNPKTPIKTYMRYSTNPEAGSWVRDYIAPWVHKDYREIEKERAGNEGRRPHIADSGEIMCVVRDGDGWNFYWPEELDELGINKKLAKTLTFIKSTVADNKYLVPDGNLDNSEYVANLHQLDIVERMRLLEGDWDVDHGDCLFDLDNFSLVSDVEIPWDRLRDFVRYWDMAATDKDKDRYDKAAYTAGVLLGRDYLTGVVYILDVIRRKLDPVQLHALVYECAQNDRDWVREVRGSSSADVRIFMEQEPGSSGNDSIIGYAKDLAGFPFEGDKVSGEKTVRAKPLATYSANGLIRVRKAPWNKDYLNEAESYPIGRKLDQIDATAGGLSKIIQQKTFFFA